MKTFSMIGMALVAMMFSFAMTSCNDDDEEYQFTCVDPYKDYPQLIVCKWFNFISEASMYVNYASDETTIRIGWDKELGRAEWWTL